MIPKFRVFIKFEGVNRTQPVSKIDFDKKEVTIEQGLKFSFDLVEIMQYTGLFDDHKNDLYFGDIFETRNYEGEKVDRYVIEYELGCFKAKNIRSKGFLNDLYFTIFHHRRDTVFKIGNRYENPELLEADEN